MKERAKMQKVSKKPLAILFVLVILATLLTSAFPVQAEEESKVEQAAAAAQAAVETLQVSNETTADDIMEAVEAAIGEATAAWSRDFFMLRAVNGAIVTVDGTEKGRTDVRDGFITGVVTVTSGEDTADVVVNRPIKAAYETFAYTIQEVVDANDYLKEGSVSDTKSYSANAPALTEGKKVAILPNTVVTFSNNTFRGTDLEVLIVPGSVKNFNYAQCRDCSKLKVVIIEDGVKEIQGESFQDCTSLKYVRLPRTLEKTGAAVFQGCTGLTDLILPSSLASAGGSSLRKTGLRELVMPPAFNTGSDWTLAENAGLTKVVTLGMDVIASSRFTQAANAKIYTWGGTDLASAVSDRFVDLASVLYAGTESLTSTVDKTAETVKLAADPAVEADLIVEYITDAGEAAYLTTDTKEFALSGKSFVGIISTVKELEEDIAELANAASEALSKLKLTNDVTAADIEEAAAAAIDNADVRFSWKQELFKLRAVNGAIVKVDGTEAGRTDVREGYILGVLTLTAGSQTADVLVSLPIEGTYEEFSYTAADVADPLDYSFNGNTYQVDSDFDSKVVIIPEDITTVADETFLNCSSLEVLIVPDSVIKFDWSQCKDCPNLKVVIMGDGVTKTEGHNFMNCTSLKYVRLPENLTKVGENTFRDCVELKNLILPASVTEFTGSALRGTGLTDLILPTNVEKMTATSLQIPNLERVLVLGADKFSFDMFANVPVNAKFYVWGNTAMATAAGDRYVDLASVLYDGTGTVSSSVEDGKVKLTFSETGSELLQLIYNAGNVSQSSKVLKDNTFEIPQANWMRVKSTTADEIITSLEKLAKDAEKNMKITASTSAKDIEEAISAAMGCEDAVITWDTAYVVKAPTQNAAGSAAGVLKVTAYGKSFTIEISRTFAAGSTGEIPGDNVDTGVDVSMIPVVAALLSVGAVFVLRRRRVAG